MKKQPKTKTMTMAAINITTEPPHKADRYIQLFNFIHKKNKDIIGRFSDNIFILSFLNEEDSTLTGEFTRYTKIDPSSSWWDIEKGKALLDDEGNPVPQIREGIGPNSKQIPFVFFPKQHRLIVDLQNITIHQCHKALMAMFSHLEIQNDFGKIHTTIIPEQDALPKVLDFHRLERLVYTLTMPNPDVNVDLEEQIAARYSTMRVGTSFHTLVSTTENGIQPDEELTATLNIASRNGYVASSGKNKDGKRETRSTKEYPKKLKRTYLDSETRLTALARLAKSILNHF